MDKIKTYKSFENLEIGVDENYEEKIDETLENLLKKIRLVNMLSDTITHVCDEIEDALPSNLESFMSYLVHYDNEIYDAMDRIKDNMIDGYPNLKDMIEDVENDFLLMKSYISLKKSQSQNGEI